MASRTMYPGEAPTPYAVMPSIVVFSTTTLPSDVYALIAAPVPLASSAGAATTASYPTSRVARASTLKPGARTPSSLVTKTLTPST